MQGTSCVPFDVNNPTANNAQWKDYANQYGPVVLGGIAAWWAAQQAAKNQPAPGQNPPPSNNDGTPKEKQGIPMWAWIAGGVVVVVVAVALLRRSAPAK